MCARSGNWPASAGRGPEQITDEEVREYFLYLKNQKRLARATTTIALCGIKFFFESTLKRDWTAMNIPRPRAEHKLPVVLSREEVRAILRPGDANCAIAPA